MRRYPLRLAVLFAPCALLATGCTEEDPRCPQIAQAVGRIAMHEVGKRYDVESEEMKSAKEQVDAQQAKVTKDCNEKLANDPSGVWNRWADCMTSVSTADEAMKCKNP